MFEEHALSGLDAAELEALLKSLRQGDVIRLESMPTLLAPDYTLYPEEVEGAPRDEAMVVSALESPTGLGVVVSQDCDLAKKPSAEAWVTVAPLLEVEPVTYERGLHGRSARYFSYPGLEGHSNLAVDAGMITTVEKTALLSPRIARQPCPLSGPRREELRQWLGRRLGRYGFPDEIQKQVVDRIAAALAKLADDQNFNRVLKAVVFYGIRYTEENAHYSFLALLDPAKLVAFKADGDLVAATKKKLFGLLAAAAKEGGYSPEVEFEDATEFRAAKLFAYSPFDAGI